jgi:transcriptional regulator
VFIHDVDAGDETEWRAFLAAHPFGDLVAGGGPERRVPVVVPTQYVLEGEDVLIHLLGRNPVWDAIAENPAVVLAVSGDWAFVPSSWKAIGDEDPRLGIPTTYYASVQLTGPVTVIEDLDGIAAVLRQQLATLQPAEDVVDPSEHGARLRAIRALRIRVDEVRAKFKYGGNVDRTHREAVLARLVDRDGPGDRAAAAHVETRIDR